MIKYTTFKYHGLVDKARIFWRVRAFNQSGGSDYSSTEVFTTTFPAVPEFALARFNFARGRSHLSYRIGKNVTWKLI